MDKQASYFPFGIHISRNAWEELDLKKLLQQIESLPMQANIFTFRQLAQRVNERRKPQEDQPGINAGDLILLSLIEEIFEYVIEEYCESEAPQCIDAGLEWVRRYGGDVSVQSPQGKFIHLFPGRSVVMEQETETQHSARTNESPSARSQLIIEMILLYITDDNPAVDDMRFLFDSHQLAEESPFIYMMASLEEYFDTLPPVPHIGQHLFKALREPILANPHSLGGQLDFIIRNWGHFLPESLRKRAMLAADVAKEETTARGFPGGPAPVLEFDRQSQYPEYERFSRDADWMSNVVLIAKSVYVWLDQLSKKYERNIYRLDLIPEEELDQLARWGFSCIWLIGVWERSPASKKIKRMMGNPEAESSAYSLYDYQIALDIGGEEAYSKLKEMAWQKGIRLASDMVPNHVGLYSKWVIEHPDWFIQSSSAPYPGYHFSSESLSWDERISLQIEDGYWNHSDAAVVFKRHDNWTGDLRYIYHGNDGTHMPWNDTAQLNYLLLEVREAVIETILHVARKFSVIRFDAAMTLAKKHFQRLWFPLPGEGGAVPSRAEHSMTREQFDQYMPEEFWREVVDRVAAEVPDTLLLAEAFWLMEGYFVRTLGMHRVYNSAFMNMLKMEENANYRATMINVLEYSPGILGRFVNFMNNPDERTAVEQFGKGDKYIGVAMMMVTMPGLPMFGHGQIEGYTEKYGMEYRKAYWNEPIDEDLVRRHEWEIFPLMRKRYVFSGVNNFALYDFRTPEGQLNENVFAYSNMASGERGLVFYNNSYDSTRGTVRMSTNINVGKPESPEFIQRTLGEVLSIERDRYYTFRDHKSGLEYLRHGSELCDKGLYLELQGYQYHVFLDFQEVSDSDGTWNRLAERLQGRGVNNIQNAYRELRLRPMLEALEYCLQTPFLKQKCDFKSSTSDEREELKARLLNFREQAVSVGMKLVEGKEFIETIIQYLRCYDCTVNKTADEEQGCSCKKLPGAKPKAGKKQDDIIPMLVLMRAIGSTLKEKKSGTQWLNEWLWGVPLGKVLDESLENMDLTLLRIAFADFFREGFNEQVELLKDMMADEVGARYLLLNRHQGKAWFNKERFEKLVHGLLYGICFKPFDENMSKEALDRMKELLALADLASYQMEKFLTKVKEMMRSSSL